MRIPPPGRLIDLGTHRIHVRSAGDGAPTVVFDAALGASSLSWSLVLPQVARVTRACAYDRAGFGWSDAGPLPRTAGRLADELHAWLQRAAIPAPYVLVGHSFGGLVVRLFAARHRNDVAGLVLMEPAIPAEWGAPSPEQRALIDRGVRLCAYGSTAARLGLARLIALLVSAGALGLARALVAAVSRGGLKREDEGILAPIWKLPPEARRVMREAWTEPKFFEALGSQIQMICESAAEVAREARDDYRDLPVAVLSGASAGAARLEADEALARLSSRGRHLLVPNSGHWIPLDAPESASAAIIDIVETARLDHAGRSRVQSRS